MRVRLDALRLAGNDIVHDDEPRARLGKCRIKRIVGKALNVVEPSDVLLQRPSLRLARKTVDRKLDLALVQHRDQRRQTANFFRRRHRFGIGIGSNRAEIDDIGAVLRQLKRMLRGRRRSQELAAVGKRIRRNIDDAEDRRRVRCYLHSSVGEPITSPCASISPLSVQLFTFAGSTEVVVLSVPW